MNIEICDFAKRQYKEDYSGTRVSPEMVDQMIQMAQTPDECFDGYADFCKIIAISNINVRSF